MVNFVATSLLVFLLRFSAVGGDRSGRPYTLVSRVQTECEAEALAIGSALADTFNALDEDTEWDLRLHQDFLVEHLGFAAWIEQGIWGSKGKSTSGASTHELMKKGGWKDTSLGNSSYWAVENKWIYMMGDSTMRQLWGSFSSPALGTDFEKNAKEWSRENCAKQFPHRKAHPPGDYPEEGWSGKCGNNEVTCDVTGFGSEGKMTFDWKHFTFEDYDEWLFGDTGKWGDPTLRRPDVLAFQIGLHTCVHAFNFAAEIMNETMVRQHTEALPVLMKAIKTAVERRNDENKQTMVIFVTPGRIGSTHKLTDACSWRFNRHAARQAHLHGFTVLEREEIERRLLFKSESTPETATIKYTLHLANPGPTVVATALLGLISCLTKNNSEVSAGIAPFDVFKAPH